LQGKRRAENARKEGKRDKKKEQERESKGKLASSAPPTRKKNKKLNLPPFSLTLPPQTGPLLSPPPRLRRWKPDTRR
jgi:hypothetical protein